MEDSMEGLLGLLIFIADIYAIIKILQSSASGLKKLIWVLIVLILPVIGLIAWFFAGPGGKAG
ncbi:PLD nuclease N-terminal domain-containing protein [Microbulbifer pacificus]|uniref:PLD nuclease N-terminal domain-containing protein n=2 Tax=Microbulbifer pacificus TaxID=407164 RepID=A0AAU0N4K1_9GAMM|nr:PLD nuclease N-terminal domain-containing protein [Microbulbifer pacificus]WOX07170.1 PLD nuclease N-terminal domain-containing protein [Microbulbifer pacificus]